MRGATWWSVPREWVGETAFIVGGGPSVLTQNIELLRGRKVIVINSSYETVSFADYLIFHDPQWWKDHKDKPEFKSFAGRVVSVSQSAQACDRRLFLHYVHPPKFNVGNPSCIAMRRTTLTGAQYFAALLGVSRIVLLGADGKMGVDRDGKTTSHHHVPHRNWKYSSKRWDGHRAELATTIEPLRQLGIEVFNASPGSAWDLWPVMTLEEAIARVDASPIIATKPKASVMHGTLKAHVRGGNQDPAELAQFLGFVRCSNVRRYLEIGCRNGDTFDAVMRTIGEGGYGVAIDLPENANAKGNLQTTVDDLVSVGIEAEVVFGNSRSGNVRAAIETRGPFDLILIDGDHRYASVKADFEDYAKLAPVVALHDVTAPRGHMSDGYENGVGVFWNEIKDRFRHQEFVTPGSQMGFGVLHRDAVSEVVADEQPAQIKAASAGTLPPMFIACPAWGKYYVDLACRYTIPAALASLKESNFDDVTFVIHTDDEASFRNVIGDHKIKFLPLMRLEAPPKDGRMPALPKNYWDAFKKAHKDALDATSTGSVVTMLNSDVVMSRECYPFVEQEIRKGKNVIVSVGIRTQIETDGGPPIGASADELFKWIWGHRHPITEQCIWDHGKSHHPTILFFEDEDGNVAMHCFHLTPMFIRKGKALPNFKGTIDDDLLGNFADDEISYTSGGEVAFAELSPMWKTHPNHRPLNVSGVLEFWRKRMVRPHYLRNFKQRMTVLGNPQVNHPAVDQIIAGLAR